MGFMDTLTQAAPGIGAGMDLLNFGFGVGSSVYQARMQQQARDDAAHAVQIRAKDMAAAGINPIMAAGAPATTMAPIKIDAPSANMSNILRGGELQQQQIGLQATQAGIEATKAQTELAKAETQKANSDAASTATQTEIALKDSGLRANADVRAQKQLDFLAQDQSFKAHEDQRKQGLYQLKLQDLQSDINLKGADLVLRHQERMLNTQGITMGDVKLVMMQIQRDALKQGIDLDLTNKKLQASVANLVYEDTLRQGQHERDLNQYKTQGSFDIVGMGRNIGGLIISQFGGHNYK